MIAGQPFSLNFASNPSFTLDASKISLKTFADCVVSNNGPGAVGIWPSGSASGPALEIIGSNQRKYIALGNVDTICLSFLKATNSTLVALTTFQLYGALIVSDDYSLTGVGDYRAGRSAPISSSIVFPTPVGSISATDCGFDKIRGIYIPPQASPPELSILGSQDSPQSAYSLLNAPGGAIAFDADIIGYANLTGTFPRPTFFVSDEPIIAGGVGGGTYG